MSQATGTTRPAAERPAVEQLSVADVELEVLRRGSGPPLLLLHGMQPVDPRARFIDLLAARCEIVAPSHPGFGRSERPAGFETVYDLVRLYLALLETLPYPRVTLVGFSFGGWLAAELAVACRHRLERLVLVDALGIKVGDREHRDILDVFNTAPAEVRRRSWHDPARHAPDHEAMTDEELVAHARGWESLCLYGWHPYMYNPQLARWLGRIAVPTLLLWGASDGVVTPAYGEAYRALIPGARLELIERAGHHPEIEQPEALASHLLRFLEG
ncbi:MAG TPA: alpha/beta hydrolase [Candidatus Bathyarchaeia archaeon]|nr:alpha/beta hydrolase [Candidatus Bathyarchaeia archaeon]